LRLSATTAFSTTSALRKSGERRGWRGQGERPPFLHSEAREDETRKNIR
jgi:hypothetical protein